MSCPFLKRIFSQYKKEEGEEDIKNPEPIAPLPYIPPPGREYTYHGHDVFNKNDYIYFDLPLTDVKTKSTSYKTSFQLHNSPKHGFTLRDTCSNSPKPGFSLMDTC